jgi:FkbM family methyltransferase
MRRLDRAAGTCLYPTLRAGLRVSQAVAPDLRARIRIVFAAILLGTGRWRRPLRIRVRGPHGSRPFWLVDHAGMLVLEEVFCDAEYQATLSRPPRRVLDLGSNIGASVLYFAQRYPGTEIVGVEASPKLFRLLQANVGDLPNVTLRNAAVSTTAEPVTFFEGVSSWAGSTRASDWTRAECGTAVEGVPLDTLLGGGVDLMKIDIEGGEFDVLPGSQRLGDVGAVLGEIHSPPGSAESEQVLALFGGCEVESTPPDLRRPQYSTIFSAIRV